MVYELVKSNAGFLGISARLHYGFNEGILLLCIYFSDDVTGGQATPPSTRPKAINYASSISFYITLQDGTSKGQIYPPYIEITYTAATEEQLDENVNVQVM